MKKFLLPLAVSGFIGTINAEDAALRKEVEELKRVIQMQQQQIELLTKAYQSENKVLGPQKPKEEEKPQVDSKVKLKVGGYVNFAIHHDDNGRNFTSAGRGGLFPVAVTSKANPKSNTLNFTPDQSRINVTAMGPDYKGWKTKGFIEGDFRSVNGDHGNFRLRHAFIDFVKEGKNLRIGQTWSSFGSAYHLAETVDFPSGTFAGVLFNRFSQIRYTTPIGSNKDLKFSLSLESDSKGETYTGTNNKIGSQSNVALSGQPWKVYTVEWAPSGDKGRSAVYWHGITNSRIALNVLDGKLDSDSLLNTTNMWDMSGWNASMILGLKTPKNGKKKGSMTFTGNMYEGNGLDLWYAGSLAQTSATAGTTKAKPSSGYFGHLDYYVAEDVLVGLNYGRSEAELEDGWTWTNAAADNMYRFEKSGSFISWQYSKNFRYGLEYMRYKTHWYNPSTNSSTSEGNNRITLLGQYFF